MYENENQQIWDAPAANYSNTPFVLGLISLITSIVCCGGGIVSLVLGIIAIVLGNKEKNINPGNQKAKTGMILGGVGIGVGIIMSIIAGAVIATGTLAGMMDMGYYY